MLINGILPNQSVTVVSVTRFGQDAVELTYKDAQGRPANELLYRERESEIAVVQADASWSFDADPRLFQLVSEAYRIRLACLFDPYLAVHTSQVEPLPHQITAVYESMLPRQPLRFLLADDPGAGKTIMAGLLIKELIARGGLRRCLIVCPGNLVEQWQDEMNDKFHLPFEVMTNDAFDVARTGNWFLENAFAICQSLKRRRERLEKRCQDEIQSQRNHNEEYKWPRDIPELSLDDIEDLDDAPEDEIEKYEVTMVPADVRNCKKRFGRQIPLLKNDCKNWSKKSR